MVRSSYDNWVAEEDRNRFLRIEQTIGELESNPYCCEAASTLFWQVFFGLEELSVVIEIERELQVREKAGYSLVEAVETLCGEENRHDADKQAAAFVLIRRDVRDSMQGPPWIGLDLAILDRILDLLLGLDREPLMSGKQISQDKLISVAFTQLHLATALLRAASKATWGSPELAEDLISRGERAFALILECNELYGGMVLSERKALELLTQAGFIYQPYHGPDSEFTVLSPKPSLQEQREHSLSAVMALFLNEQFKANRRQNRNEEALSCFGMAMALWTRSLSSLEGELSLQAAVNCCEDIFLNKSAISDWESVADSCCLVLDHLSESPDSDEFFVLGNVLGKDGWSWSAVSYWQRARTRAENEMSPSQLKRYQDLERRSIHIDRLRSDFLEDLIGVLEPESLKALVQAEVDWYVSQPMGGRIEATANELRLVFEHELRAIVFKRVQPSLNKILQNRDSRERLNIKSRSVGKLNLREMANFLKEAKNSHSVLGLPIMELIAGFPIAKKDKDFLYMDLPNYLGEFVTDVRNPSEHPGGVRASEIESRIREVRRKALGIGEESYLVRLLTIKRAVGRKS